MENQNLKTSFHRNSPHVTVALWFFRRSALDFELLDFRGPCAVCRSGVCVRVWTQIRWKKEMPSLTLQLPFSFFFYFRRFPPWVFLHLYFKRARSAHLTSQVEPGFHLAARRLWRWSVSSNRPDQNLPEFSWQQMMSRWFLHSPSLSVRHRVLNLLRLLLSRSEDGGEFGFNFLKIKWSFIDSNGDSDPVSGA